VKRRAFLAAAALATAELRREVLHSRGGRAPAVTALLWHDSPNDLKALEGFRRGFRVLERSAPTLVRAERDAGRARLGLQKAEAQSSPLVLALGTRAALVAKETLTRTPLVFTAVTHPVLSGVVGSWEASGENIAGNSNWLDRGEMMRSFRAAVPGMRRLGVIATRGNAVSAAEIAEAGRALGENSGLELKTRFIAEGEKLEALLPSFLKGVDALWLPIDFALYQDEPLKLIVEATRKAQLPLVSSSERCAGKGALLVVAVDYELLGLRAAAIARRILGGADPATMPVGRLTSSRLYVDLDAARAIARELPLDLLLRAWRVFGKRVR
jgi:putative tryptophan/tyrosine transport system substrate-binding protein